MNTNERDLRVVGVLGVLDHNRTPAFVEAVVIDAVTGDRLAWTKAGYVQPEPFDAAEVVMVALPSQMRADAAKHVLLLGPNELSALRKFTQYEASVSALVDWSKHTPLLSDPALGAVPLENGQYAAMLVTPAQSAVLLGHIGKEFTTELKAAMQRNDEAAVVTWSWRVQRAARGDLSLMAVAAAGFEHVKRGDLVAAMRRATVTSETAWASAREEAKQRLCESVCTTGCGDGTIAGSEMKQTVRVLRMAPQNNWKEAA